MAKSLESVFDCYCGFQNKIVFQKPTVLKKSWLEHSCLNCDAKYDLRIYLDGSQYKLFKRLVKTSNLVNEAIAKDAKKSAEINNFKFKDNGVLDGKTADSREKSKDH